MTFIWPRKLASMSWSKKIKNETINNLRKSNSVQPLLTNISVFIIVNAKIMPPSLMAFEHFLTDWVIYLYIYIYMCVCVCVKILIKVLVFCWTKWTFIFWEVRGKIDPTRDIESREEVDANWARSPKTK